MKILWHSVSPWVGSGYGQQTAQATQRIKAAGHDLAISCYYGLFGTKQIWKGITCLPAYAESYGKDTVVPHAMHHFGAGEGDVVRDVAARGLVITLGDVWVFDQPALKVMNVAAWVPIDHETVPPMVANWFGVTGAIPIAMSRFGEAKLRDLGHDPLYVPHAVDTSVFRPGDKAEARQRVGLPQDAFVVAMVAANFGRDGARKAFHEQIVAFAKLRRQHPDAVLALHTDITNPHGVNIRDLLADLPENSYVVTDQYAYRVGVPAETVADIYRAADVLTNTSWGEGFGIPIVEAQACGTPVVVTDTTAMPELVGAGWKVPGQPLWHDSQRAWAKQPLIGGIVDAYEEAYDKARDDSMRAQAWAFAQDYDADRVFAEYWVPALKKLEAAVDARRDAPARPSRRPVVEADGLLWLDQPGPEKFGEHLGPSNHEESLRPLLEALLPVGGTFLDVGAHVGHWALRMAERAGVVVAIEPNPRAASVLRRNIAMNDLGGRVEVVELAAWDADADLHLHHPGGQGDVGGSTRVLTEGGGVTVQAARLDEVLKMDRLDLVKMDVEGADLPALRGMAGLLKLHAPTLLIECHDYVGYYTRGDLHATLQELGYQYQVGQRFWSYWTPDGPTDVPVAADYLVAVPKNVTLPDAAQKVINEAMADHGSRPGED